MTRARDVANLIGSGNYSSTTFTATAGQTAFTISHTQGFVQVFMNGLLLDETVDYTSNGSAVTLTSGAAAGDEIEVVAYNTFSVGDALPKSGGAMTGALTVDAAAATVLTVDRATSDGTIIDVQKDGSTVGSIGVDNSDNLYIQGNSSHAGIQFGTNSAMPHTNGNTSDNAEDLGTSNTRWKDLYLSGGAYIGGTAAANYLNDYEEGTWTPILVDGTTTIATTQAVGMYIKIGEFVLLQGSIRRNSATNYTGNLRIQALPFDRRTITNLVPLGSGWGWIDNGTGYDRIGQPYLNGAADMLFVMDHRVDNTRYFTTNDLNNGRPIYFCVSYRATA